jgi:hypothetical protein
MRGLIVCNLDVLTPGIDVLTLLRAIYFNFLLANRRNGLSQGETKCGHLVTRTSQAATSTL